MKHTITAAAQAAGRIIQDNYGKKFTMSKKAPKDIVTAIDLKCEKEIIRIIQKKFPSHTIISEEQGTTRRKSAYSWVIDPIDGTTNFSRGIPFFAVSIALVKDEQQIMGAVYDPVRDELFFAEKGKGAVLNGKRIHVSRVSEIKESIVNFDFRYYAEDFADRSRISNNLVTSCFATRKLHSAALGLAYVACGRIDGNVHYLLNPHDYLGGAILVLEAGGKVTDFSGKDVALQRTSLFASNGILHKELLKIINAK